MKTKLAIILIIIIGFLCYFNALFGEFIWDDYYLIVQNNLIKDPNNIAKLFTTEVSDNFDYYRPMQLLTYLTDHYFYKMDPPGYHLTSVVIHVLNAILVFLILSFLLGNNFVALASSLLFVSAPFYTEAVTYIAGRADLLLGLFFLLSFLFYIRRKFMLALLFFIFSLLCREQAMVLPFIFILYDRCFKKNYRDKAKYYLLFFLYDFLYIVLRLTVFNFSQKPVLFRMRYFFPQVDFLQRLLIFLKSIIEYFKIIIYPANLHMERKMQEVKSILTLDVLSFVLVLIGLIYVIIRFRRHRRIILFCLFWFLILLLPQSSFVFPLIMAEHFLYLPCIGVFIIIAFLLGRLRQNNRKMAWIVLISFVLYYSFLTIAYNINWKNPLIFYRWNLKFAPNSYKLHYLLGNYYLDMGNIDLAFNEYEKALEFDNNFMFSKINVKYYEDAYKGNNLIFAKLNHNLGVILNKRNYIQEAQESFKKAIELNPGLVESYNDLGLLYIKNNELDKAEEILNAGLEANPKFEKIYYNLGVIYVQKNDRTKALKYWNKALELNLDYVAAREGVKRLNEQD